jgi:predicted DNA-binding protein YlxM (UPF0122 family)
MIPSCGSLAWRGLRCQPQRASLLAMRKLLSVNEYARRKRISPQAVYKKIKNKKLDVVMLKVEQIRIAVDVK